MILEADPRSHCLGKAGHAALPGVDPLTEESLPRVLAQCFRLCALWRARSGPRVQDAPVPRPSASSGPVAKLCLALGLPFLYLNRK